MTGVLCTVYGAQVYFLPLISISLYCYWSQHLFSFHTYQPSIMESGNFDYVKIKPKLLNLKLKLKLLKWRTQILLKYIIFVFFPSSYPI